MGKKRLPHTRATQPDPAAAAGPESWTFSLQRSPPRPGSRQRHRLHRFRQRHLLSSGAEAHGRLRMGGPGSHDWAPLQRRLGNGPLVSTLGSETPGEGSVSWEGRCHSQPGAARRPRQLLPQPDPGPQGSQAPPSTPRHAPHTPRVPPGRTDPPC